MVNQVRFRTERISYVSIPLRVTVRVLLLACVVHMGAPGKSKAQEAPNVAALAQLRGLTGEWEGSYEWTGARTATGQVNATYYETGNGSAVVENLAVDGVSSMTSVYHLDGADLRMTHYCAAQNQPRLRARQIDIAKGVLYFDFVDVTNLRSPDTPHVHGLEMRLLSADHITLTFSFEGSGKSSKEFIDLKRFGNKPSSK
jgi:hypothetical protein